MGNVLFVKSQDRRERGEHRIAVIGPAAAIELVVPGHGNPWTRAFRPARDFGLFVEMTVKEDRVVGLARDLDEDQRCAPFETHDVEFRARQFLDLLPRPRFEQRHRLVHVAVLDPFRIEGGRFVGDADVIGQRGKNVVFPDALHELADGTFVHRLISYAAITAVLKISLILALSGAIWMERSKPTSSGPITETPPTCCNSLVEMDAEWMAGMMRTFAVSVRRQNG